MEKNSVKEKVDQLEYDIPLRVAVAGNVDSGKCFKKDTPVLMFDGRVKMIQDLYEGDFVMGDDSQSREVIGTTSGKDIMYKVEMKRGGEYTVNSHHILCLKRTNIEMISIDNNRKAYTCRWWENVSIKNKRFYWGENKEKSYFEAERFLKEDVPKLPFYKSGYSIIDIPIKDYLMLPKYVKKELYGYKVGATFKHKDVKLDPYLLGLWLGNGTSIKPSITTIDKPIIDYMNRVCEKNNWTLTNDKNKNTINYTINNIDNTSNPFWDLIKYYKLDNNKHIPDEYKYNSPEIQLQVLAGILDIDGHYDKRIFSITQENKKLLEDLEFICRSLGFWTSIHEKFNKKFQKMYYNMNVVGNLETIPTLIPRKQAHKRFSKVGFMVSAIKVIKLDKDQYFGISLKGNNQRFLLGNFIVTHNSSLLGVLKSGEFDDGNGKARRCIFNYPHEQQTGRTSSVTQRSIFVNNKRILFFDMAGHERYLRTTLFGISSSYPDVALILIEGSRDLVVDKADPRSEHKNLQFNQMTKEHIITCIYYRIPIIFVITKMDIAYKHIVDENIKNLKNMMNSEGIKVYKVNNENDIQFSHKFFSEKVAPLFMISSVKGNDINPPFHYLTDFLHGLNIKKGVEEKSKALFIADKSFKVSGFPLIASGYMKSGKISVNDKLYLGPINGEYLDVTVRSLHNDDKTNVAFLRKDEMGCIAFKVKGDVIKNKRHVRAGMIFTTEKKKFVKRFIGKVQIFSHHSTTIKKGCNTVIHCGAIKQPVVIEEIANLKGKRIPCIKGKEVAYIKFAFMKEKYYVEENEIFVFREGHTRGAGEIKKIIE